MEFSNEFTVPLDVDRALDVLSDLGRVARSFPGAMLESVNGDTYTGRVKVKVGPMSLTYSGEATVTEVEREAPTARIEGDGEAAGDTESASGPDLEPVAPRDEALDLIGVVGPPAARRLLPVAVSAVALLVLRSGDEE